MASLPEVQPAPKKHRIGQKAGQALELGLAQVAAANVLKKVEQHLNRNPHLIPKVAGMISSDLLTPQPDLPQPSGTPTEIPQPMVRFWQLPAFRLDLMLKEMEPDLFNTMLQQINTETKRNLFYFALNVNGQMRIDKPDPPYWSTFQNNSVNAYRHLGKRMSSALHIQDDTVHVHRNFLLDNGAVNWASTIGHFIISTGHPETVVLLSVPAQTQLTHTHTLPGADQRLLVTRRTWPQSADDNCTMVMGPNICVEEVAESRQWQIDSNWHYEEAKASSGALNMKLGPLYEAAITRLETANPMAGEDEDDARVENEVDKGDAPDHNEEEDLS
jgi:hypothetical protein